MDAETKVFHYVVRVENNDHREEAQYRIGLEMARALRIHLGRDVPVDVFVIAGDPVSGLNGTATHVDYDPTEPIDRQIPWTTRNPPGNPGLRAE